MKKCHCIASCVFNENYKMHNTNSILVEGYNLRKTEVCYNKTLNKLSYLSCKYDNIKKIIKR